MMASSMKPSSRRRRSTAGRSRHATHDHAPPTQPRSRSTRGSRRSVRSRCSSGLPRLLAEQALRPEDHDQHRGRRTRSPASTRSRSGCRRSAGCMPMIRPPSTAPLRLPMPPMTAAVNAIRPALEALEVPDRRLVQRVDQAGGAGHHAAEQERQRDRRVDVDAHQARGLGVLRGRAHRLARAGCG